MNNEILADYGKRLQEADREIKKYKKLANTYSLLRLGVFALLIAGISAGIAYNNFTIIAVSAVLLVLVFAWLVSQQSKFEGLRNYYKDVAAVIQNEIDSITAKANLYDDGTTYINDRHYYTSDLDIFGGTSLFELTNRAATSGGNQRLALWFKAPANKDTIVLRQQAVNDIAQKSEWKLTLQALLLFTAKAREGELQRLFNYLEMPLSLPGEKWLKTYSFLAPYLFISVLIIAIIYPALKGWVILIGLFNLLLVISKSAYVKKADVIADKIGDTLSRYAKAFKKIEFENWNSKHCSDLSNQLKAVHTSAQINALAILITKLNYHLNIIVGIILNVVFIWDIRQIIAIEQWKRDNRVNLQASFDVLAEFEALISLASLRINYPNWVMPGIADGEGYTLMAKNIMHPLIPTEKSIANSYELSNTYKVDIITGSNMAGKSTFLRTLGINTVLALCGAPVCADEMQVSVVTIISYMRIKDSLNESTSTFKAELDRLQMLLAAVETEPKVFFLIDEMLRGTNSVDKYRGSKAVIKQLITKHGVGLVATHDLQIAQLEDEYTDYVRNFYFDIQIDKGEMLFDYKLKHGECKTFNASLLLKQIGINTDDI